MMKLVIDGTIELKKDGTLVVHVKEGEGITRVMVVADDHKGDIFYPDGD